MNIHLSPQHEAMIKEKIDSGEYRSASEIVRDALLLMEEREQLRKIRFELLRREIIEADDSIERDGGRSLDMEKIKGRARARLERERGGE